MWKQPGSSSGSYYQFSHSVTSLTRHVAMYTALACGAPCSMPVKLGHWPRRICSACSAMIGPWSDRSAVSSQRTCHGKFKWITGKAWGPQPHFERRLRWFGHVERSSGAIRTAYDMQIDGRWGAGRPKLTWKKLTERDCRERKLKKGAPGDQVWDLLCVQLIASYLDRLYWCGWCPWTCTVIKNLIMMMMIWRLTFQSRSLILESHQYLKHIFLRSH